MWIEEGSRARLPARGADSTRMPASARSDVNGRLRLCQPPLALASTAVGPASARVARVYSHLSARIGSTRAARRDGKNPAASATNASTATEAARATGSALLISNNWVRAA